MKIFKISIFVLIVSIIFISCASIKKYNPPAKEKTDIYQMNTIEFKRANIVLSDGSEMKVKDAVLDRNSETLNIIQNKLEINYQLRELKSLQYSNNNLAGQGGLLGGILGVITSVLVINNNKSNGSRGDAIQVDASGLVYFTLVPLGILIGHKIGSRIYVDWQEYDLPGDFAGRQALMDYRRNRQVTVGLRFPIRR